MSRYNIVTIVGPTASGKTSFACRLASEFGGEIISGDSRQVYRQMDIGTGKDLSDYNVDGKRIPYHLIDIHEAGYKYNIYEFQHDFHVSFTDDVVLTNCPMKIVLKLIDVVFVSSFVNINQMIRYSLTIYVVVG